MISFRMFCKDSLYCLLLKVQQAGQKGGTTGNNIRAWNRTDLQDVLDTLKHYFLRKCGSHSATT